MKKVILLLIVLGALIGLAVVMRDTSENRLKPIQSREKLLADLDVNAVKKIRIKDGDKSTTVAQVGDGWTVAERSNYPASYEKVRKTLLDLKEQKAGNQRKLGKGGWGDVKLRSPGDGKADEAGLQLELLGDGDKAIATLVLGKNISSSTVGKEESPYGGGGSERYARVASDPETAVWVVANQFYDLQPRAEDWIDKAFIDVQKVKEVEVSALNAADSWKASRKDAETPDFTLSDAKPGEELDGAKATLSSVLQNPTFTDVSINGKAAPDFMKDATKVKLTTFDGFTYNVQIIKKGTGSEEKYYMSVAVAADIPKERPAVKDEKPEDKKKNDDEFNAKKTEKEEKLAKEKKAEGWIYEISSYTVTSLLKKRSEVLKDKPKDEPKKDGAATAAPATAPTPAPKPPASAPAVPSAPRTPVTVTTPPVAVPPMPAPPKPDDLKAPAKDPLPPVAPTQPQTKPSAPEAAKPSAPPPPPAPDAGKPSEPK